MASSHALSADERWDIAEVLARYCRGLDTKDYDKLASVFTEDAVGDYAQGDGTVDLKIKGQTALVDFLRVALEQWDLTHHLIGLPTIYGTPEGAHSEVLLIAQHVRHGTPGGDQMIFAGWYIDDLVRAEDGWRIADRAFVPGWKLGNEAVLRPMYEELEPQYGVK